MDNNMKTKNRVVELLEMQDKKLISNKDFLGQFGKEKVFYSTPYGDHKDGKPRLFLLPGPDGTGYFPAFSSMERLKEFYDYVGRVGYLVMESKFRDVIRTTLKVNNDGAPVKMGIIVDPGYFNMTIDEKFLEIVLPMT